MWLEPYKEAKGHAEVRGDSERKDEGLKDKTSLRTCGASRRAVGRKPRASPLGCPRRGLNGSRGPPALPGRAGAGTARSPASSDRRGRGVSGQAAIAPPPPHSPPVTPKRTYDAAAVTRRVTEECKPTLYGIPVVASVRRNAPARPSRTAPASPQSRVPPRFLRNILKPIKTPTTNVQCACFVGFSVKNRRLKKRPSF